jgi:hypothetical protein
VVATDATGLFRLDLSDTKTCYVNIELEQDSTLEIVGTCPDNHYLPITMQLPITWLQIDFMLDRQNGIASIAVNGGPSIMLTFTSAGGAAHPSMQLGIDVPNNSGFAVGYDDLTVTTN